MNDTAIIIAAYTYGATPEVEAAKRYMTKTLVKNAKKSGYPVCLTTHSTIDEETQKMCDVFIYDENNSFKVNGLPTIDHVHGYGVAHLVAVHNAINVLERMGVKRVLKLCYDNIPNIDYKELVERCIATGKRAVTAKWGNNVTLGDHMYFADIDFIKETFNLNEVWRCDKFTHLGGDMEYVWFDSVAEKGKLDDIHLIENYHDFLGFDILQFCEGGGIHIRNYPFE
jgi:hypothetical protein